MGSAESEPFVLVVDDDPLVQDLLVQVLDSAGYRVEVAADGTSALEKTRTVTPQVILLDFRMPRMDGWEFLKRIHEDPRLGQVPILAISEFAVPEETAERLSHLGIRGYLSKPFGIKRLLDQVQRVAGAPLPCSTPGGNLDLDELARQ